MPTTNPISLFNMAPGSSTSRTFRFANSGSVPFAYTLTTTLSTGVAANALWTDGVNGLHLELRRGAAVVYDGPVAVANLAMGIVLQPAGFDDLTYNVYLPVTAGNALQGLTTTFDLTWTATGT